MSCFFVFFCYVVIDKKMDEKELSDPLNNVSVIKGKYRHHWFEVNDFALFCSSNGSYLTQHISLTECGKGGGKPWVTLKMSVWPCKDSWMAFRAYGAVDGLVLEASVSCVNSLLEDGVSLHRGHVSWLMCVSYDI